MANFRPNLLQETYERKKAIEAKIVSLKQEVESVEREKAQAVADVVEAHAQLLAISESVGHLEEAVEAYALLVTGTQGAADDLLRATVVLAEQARGMLVAVQAKAEAVVSGLESKRKEVDAKTKAMEDRNHEVRRKEDDLNIYRTRIEKAAEVVGIKVIL